MNKIFSYVAIPASMFDRAFQFYSVITEGLIVRNELVLFPMAYFVDKENN